MARLNYPIGIQDFREIRTKGYHYLDKTTFIHRILTEGKYYFLSRPRRFGKSLLLSTIKEIYSGSREVTYAAPAAWAASRGWAVEPDKLDGIEGPFGEPLPGAGRQVQGRQVFAACRRGLAPRLLARGAPRGLLRAMVGRGHAHLLQQQLRPPAD